MTTYGFFLSSEERSGSEIVRYARDAEQAGFTHLWVSDHFHPWTSAEGQSPFVWSVLGGVAATTDLTMTTAVTCPTFRIHPAIVAHAAATVAEMAPGRFRLGVGAGEALNEHILGDPWPPVSVRHDRLREAIELIRQLWDGDVVTHDGEYYAVYDAKLWTLPDTPPEILVSGFGPQAVELAAEVGDGWVAVTPDSEGMATYRRAGGKGRTQGGLKFCWAQDEADAAQTAWRYWGQEGVEGQLLQDVPMWMGYEAIRDLRTPEQVADAVPCGPDPEKVASAVKAYVDAGFDEVYLSQMGPDQEGGLRFLSEQVVPLLA